MTAAARRWSPRDAATSASAAVEARKFSFWYGEKQALYELDVSIPDKSITALIGPSGCGKSTFLRSINRMNETIPGTRHDGDILLDGEEIYSAVSYVWGNSEQIHEIILDGKPFGVAKNLYQLLTELATRRYSGCLWIDALCIDQSNLLERNHQVALMGTIYAKAEKVLVWLGPGTNDLCRALVHLQDFETLKKRYLEDSDIWDGLHLKGMLEFCDHEYWTRAWIVQEFLLAQSVEIWCGELSLDLQVLSPIRFSRHDQKIQQNA